MFKTKFVLIQKSAYFTDHKFSGEKNTFSVKHNQKSQEIINIFG